MVSTKRYQCKKMEELTGSSVKLEELTGPSVELKLEEAILDPVPNWN